MKKIKSMSKVLGITSSILILAGCLGGGGGDAGTSGRDTDTSAAEARGVSTCSDSPLKLGSCIPFAGQPVLKITRINDNNIVDPMENESSDGKYRLGDTLTATSVDTSGQPIAPGNLYLVTLEAPAPVLYISPTRDDEGISCAGQSRLSGRLCDSKDGRRENLQVKWRAITDFKTGNINVNPLSSLVVERTRFLSSPSGGGKAIDVAKKEAETTLKNLFFNTNTAYEAETGLQAASLNITFENLGNAAGITVSQKGGLLIGLLERLAQQMFKTKDQLSAMSGYSKMYDILFASFGRDGKFESLEQAVQGGSVGPRAASSLLNSALTEHLIKDATRFSNVAINNFNLQDFLRSPGALDLRQSIASAYRELFESNSGAVATVAYVSNDGAGKVLDHVISAIPARTAGMFFLDSRGEAQDGSKPSVACSPTQLGLDANYEFTGVASLDGGPASLMLAYSHTSTKAVLIDVRQVGLDGVLNPATVTCSISSSGYRVIDFRNVAQNNSLYQNAPQYSHLSRPVTLTSARYDATKNQLLVTTLDGVLKYDVVPAADMGSLAFVTQYSSFRKFPSFNNASPGLSMNPAFDEVGRFTLEGSAADSLDAESFGIGLLSPFDYGSSTLRGLYSFKFTSATEDKTQNPAYLLNAANGEPGTPIPQMAALARLNKLAAVSGADTDSGTCLDPTRSVKNSSAFRATGGVNLSVDATGTKFSKVARNVRLTLPVPSCSTGTLRVSPNTGAFECNTPATNGFLGIGATPERNTPPTYSVNAQNQNALTPAQVSTANFANDGILYGKCASGYHGVTFENRYQSSSSASLLALAVGESNPFVIEQGMVNLLTVSDFTLTNAPASKPFVILKNKSLTGSSVDMRSLVLDDIRSYGVIRSRGTFPKSLGYFLAKDTTGKFSLIEVDLDQIRNIPDTLSENNIYKIPTTSAESKSIAGPVRVYFR